MKLSRSSNQNLFFTLQQISTRSIQDIILLSHANYQSPEAFRSKLSMIHEIIAHTKVGTGKDWGQCMKNFLISFRILLNGFFYGYDVIFPCIIVKQPDLNKPTSVVCREVGSGTTFSRLMSRKKMILVSRKYQSKRSRSLLLFWQTFVVQLVQQKKQFL